MLNSHSFKKSTTFLVLTYLGKGLGNPVCAHIIKSLSCSLYGSDAQVDGAGNLHPGVSELESSTWTWLMQLVV